MYIAVHTKYEEDKWLAGFIAEKDLFVNDPEDLIYERDQAQDRGRIDLALSKHLAYLAITEEQ